MLEGLTELWDSLVQSWQLLQVFLSSFPPLGYLLIGLAFVWTAVIKLYLWYIGDSFFDAIDWTVLAVDVPAESLKTPQVMENVLAGLHGIQTRPNLIDKYWYGKAQEPIALEIVGIDGYVKFLIRCADYHIDLVKAHFYAQYPDAEIYEVEDYLDGMPDNIMAQGDYDIFGSEMDLVKEDAYPIMTYPDFE